MALKQELLHEYWAETLATVFMLLGFFFSLLLQQPGYIYFTALAAGFLAGRMFYLKRYAEPVFPFVLIIIGFTLGFTLGSFGASRKAVLVLFLLSVIASYWLHRKELIPVFKAENWVK